MKKLSEIDKNFAINTDVMRPDMVLRDSREDCFSLHGLFWEGDRFRRIPKALAEQTNEGYALQHANTAGGRLRFITNSPYIALFVTLPFVNRFPHMPMTGICGFDMYMDNVFKASIQPPIDTEGKYTGIAELDGQMHDIMIDFPLYNDVTELMIGLAESATVLPARPYSVVDPVVFYGSSITQGGCASRPGTYYAATLSRELDFDYINIGVSGSSRGERCIAEYIAGLKLSAFIMDYDHNAANLAELKATHEPFFRIVREAQPDLPILLLSAPNVRHTGGEWVDRADVVYATYRNAIASDDKNVWWIRGDQLLGGRNWDNCLVDGCHPNDLGFWRMADAVSPILRQMLHK